MEVDGVEGEVTWEERLLGKEVATKFRAAVARLNFLSIERADIQYSTKEVARKMSAPCNGDWATLNRIGNYLLLRPRVVHCFKWQDLPGKITVYVDANWAGCPRTRRSTTGVALVHGSRLIRSFSQTQSNIALPSAEADLYAIVSAASEGLGSQAMARDFGGHLKVDIFVDASAAIGVAQRKGLGRIRHLDTQALWVQDAVRHKKVELIKVRGTQNPADMMTKYLDGTVLKEMMGRMHLEVRDGRPEIAPKVAKDYDDEIYQQDQGDQEEVDSLDVIYENYVGSSAQGIGTQEGMSVEIGGCRVENPVGYRDESLVHSVVPQSFGIPQACSDTLGADILLASSFTEYCKSGCSLAM